MALALQTGHAVIHTHVMRFLTRISSRVRPSPAVAGLLLLWLATGGCSGLRRERPVLDTSRDPQIVEAVTARLASEPALASADIRVEALGGRVLLYGSVYGLGQWNCAIRAAELTDGVRSVVDYLVIERGPREVRCGASRHSDDHGP